MKHLSSRSALSSYSKTFKLYNACVKLSGLQQLNRSCKKIFVLLKRDNEAISVGSSGT